MIKKIFLISALLSGFSVLAAGQDGGTAEIKAREARSATLYNLCLDLVEKDPKQAVNQALKWQLKEESGPAKHCEALGLYHMGQYRAAGLLLNEVAALMRTGKNMPTVDGKGKAAKEYMLAQMFHQSALAWTKADNLEEALKAADQAVMLSAPDSQQAVDMRLSRARIYAKDGDYEPAFQDLTAIKSELKTVDHKLLYASAARLTGREKIALESLTLVLITYTDNVTALMERGNLLNQMGQDKAAQEDWFRVIELEPDSAAAGFARKNIQRKAYEQAQAAKKKKQKSQEKP